MPGTGTSGARNWGQGPGWALTFAAQGEVVFLQVLDNAVCSAQLSPFRLNAQEMVSAEWSFWGDPKLGIAFLELPGMLLDCAVTLPLCFWFVCVFVCVFLVSVCVLSSGCSCCLFRLRSIWSGTDHRPVPDKDYLKKKLDGPVFRGNYLLRFHFSL